MGSTSTTEHSRYVISQRERATLLAAVLIISICALTYELIVATLSSYLLGNSITQFSLTIGVFLFAMGLGSILSRRIKRNELRWFILTELAIGVFGGLSAITLYAVFAATDLYYTAIMIIVSLLIGICVGLEIPLLTRIVASEGTLGDALADVLSVDYIGALVASLLFPLVLLPLLGVTLTAFLTGLFNVLVAFVLLQTFGDRLTPPWRRLLFGGCTVVTLGMVAGIGFSTDLVEIFERRLYRAPIIYTDQTLYQRVVITRNDDDVRLFLDGNLQFSTRDEYRYHEMLVHPAMNAARSRERVLVLGGGDGLVARELLKYGDVGEIIVVDLDPEVTRLAREFPLIREANGGALDDPRVRVINADAYTYVEENTDLFSVIIADLPDPNNEGLSKLYSQTFYRMIRERLTPDGLFVTQATSPYFVRESYWMIVNTLESADLYTVPMQTYVPTFGNWGFVVAGRLRPPDLAVPAAIDLRYLTPTVLQNAQTFDPDTERIDTAINTLDRPVLPRVYEAGWARWQN